jgi:ELWxxDGT repeat protein
VGGTLYFTANGESSGFELWKSNGTEAGTLRVKDIRAGSGSAVPRYLTNVEGTLYFRANDGASGYELWKSNGTEAGTLRVKDIQTGLGSAGLGMRLHDETPR